MRKIFGLYESELNQWLSRALDRVEAVIDVGANDGYFTFGCAAAMKRRGRAVKVISCEPNPKHVAQLRLACERAGYTKDEVTVLQNRVGHFKSSEIVTLDDILVNHPADEVRAIKIDVEGAELEVLAGAKKVLNQNTLLLIEVHQVDFLNVIASEMLPAVGYLDLIQQKPLPFLGYEERDRANWWLVSRLG
jgi:hypothetical protein